MLVASRAQSFPHSRRYKYGHLLHLLPNKNLFKFPTHCSRLIFLIKMRCFSLQTTALTILIALLACSSSFQASSAGKTYTRPVRTIGKAHGTRHSGGRKLMDDGYKVIPLKAAASSTTFNVLSFGAKGDGKADDTKVIFIFSFFFY